MDVKDIKAIIKDQGIETIRLDYPDMHGVCRGKYVPARRVEELLEEGANFAKPIFAIMLNNDIPPATGVAEEVGFGDMKVVPDPATFTLLPYMDKTARFIGDIYADGKPWPFSPRWALKSVIKAYNDLGLKPIAACEMEFFAFKPNGNGQVSYYSDAPACVYTGNLRSDPQDLLRKLQDILLKMGFDVLYSNAEYYAGQYEFNWKHDEALRMADQTFTYKTVCKEVGHLNDLLITFMSKPRNDSGGNGMHVHYSLADLKTGKNLFADPDGPLGMSELMRQFIAGQLRHAKGMTAFCAPTFNCYKRFAPYSFAPVHVAWGLDNRTTYIRVPGERGGATRIENRGAGAPANPYLVLAAGLLAGLQGIREKLDAGEPFLGDLYAEPGEHPALAQSLAQALDDLRADTVLCDAIGPQIIQNFTALKGGELESLRKYVTDWEFNHYSFHL